MLPQAQREQRPPRIALRAALVSHKHYGKVLDGYKKSGTTGLRASGNRSHTIAPWLLKREERPAGLLRGLHSSAIETLTIRSEPLKRLKHIAASEHPTESW